jgi:hypothetical protein
MHLPANYSETEWLNLRAIIIEAKIRVLGRAETGVGCIVSNHGFTKAQTPNLRKSA